MICIYVFGMVNCQLIIDSRFLRSLYERVCFENFGSMELRFIIPTLRELGLNVAQNGLSVH